MKIVSDKVEMIFKHEKNDKIFYSIGLSHKNKEGNYDNDYMPVRFRKDVYLVDGKTRIKIKDAWLDFYKGMKFIFINDFEVVEEENKETPNKIPAGKDIEIDPEELPFY